MQVHCPREYNRLEVEVAATGERLTPEVDRRPQDFFHSRLAVSPDGLRLLSAGWMWHPWGRVDVFDLTEAWTNPAVLDAPDPVFGLRGLLQAEVAGACFTDGGVVLSTSSEENDSDGPDDLEPNMLAHWSERERRYLWRRRLDRTAGDLVLIGDGVLGLYGHLDSSTSRTGH